MTHLRVDRVNFKNHPGQLVMAERLIPISNSLAVRRSANSLSLRTRTDLELRAVITDQPPRELFATLRESINILGAHRGKVSWVFKNLLALH